jgi:hypothetical protein
MIETNVKQREKTEKFQTMRETIGFKTTEELERIQNDELNRTDSKS